MELKTRVAAEEGRHHLLITRDFDLPVDLLFKAHSDPELLAQWMGTNVLKLEARQHGGWQFETTDAQGKPVFRAHGTFHDFIPSQKMVRTFEMEGAPFGVQLELLGFEALDEDRSRLTIQVFYQSGAHRDAMLKMPFAQGLNGAHNRLQQIAGKLVHS